MSRKGELLIIFGSILSVLGVHAEMAYFAHQGKLRTVAMIGDGAPAGTGTVAKITSLGDRKFGDSWNVQFSGVMDITAAGQHEFDVSSDDGSALYVDGREVVMNDGLHGPSSRKGTVDLPVGKHQVNLLYFNHGGGHSLKAEVKAPGRQPVDLAVVCTPSNQKQDMAQMREQERRKDEAAAQKALTQLSPPEALVRSIKHILKTKPRAYKNGRAFLKQAEAYVLAMPSLLEKYEKGDAQAIQALDDYGKLKHTALIDENPYIDFDETLVILSDKMAVKANWLGTHVLAPKGYKNKIARFNIRTGQITDIYAPKDGAYVGELDVYYDADKLLFTSTDAGNVFQVMEVGVDGSKVRQVSTIAGEYVHNYGGIYLPNDKIVFSSTAPMIGVPCISGTRTVPNLYVMGPDGENVRQLTFEQDADWYPTVREDGQVMYLRWEYTDIMHYYSRIMMSMNPDGSNQRAIYGSQSLWPNAMFNARPLPGEPGKFVAVVSGHHGVAAPAS